MSAIFKYVYPEAGVGFLLPPKAESRRTLQLSGRCDFGLCCSRVRDALLRLAGSLCMAAPPFCGEVGI